MAIWPSRSAAQQRRPWLTLWKARVRYAVSGSESTTTEPAARAAVTATELLRIAYPLTWGREGGTAIQGGRITAPRSDLAGAGRRRGGANPRSRRGKRGSSVITHGCRSVPGLGSMGEWRAAGTMSLPKEPNWRPAPPVSHNALTNENRCGPPTGHLKTPVWLHRGWRG